MKFQPNVNLQDNEGMTALHYAAKAEKLPVIELLLKNGADVNATTNSGYSALKLATIGNFCVHSRTRTNEDVVTLIKKHIRDKLMEEILKTALIVKKGLTQKRNELLVPYAQKEIIHRIASFF